MKPDPEWKHVASTVNTEVYQVRDDLLAVLPHHDTRESQETARANLAVQKELWDRQGHGGGVVIFMDEILAQDAGARAVYATEAGETGSRCFALIGESYFAMAASAVYTGLARPSVPLQVFRNYEDALPWVDEILHKTRA